MSDVRSQKTRLRPAEAVLRRGTQKTEVFEFGIRNAEVGISDQSAEGLAQRV